MSIGENIKKARLQAGLTQKELGEKLGITFQSIAQWETGRRTPKQETVKRIASALGVSWYELLSDDPEEQAKAIKAYMSEKIAMCGDQEYTKRAFLAREITTDYYDQLNTDGKLAAYKIIYERIDNDALYDSIQDFKALVDTPQYQKKPEE